MAYVSYTDKQMEVANLLRSVSNDGVSPEVADEIINMVGDAEQKTTVDDPPKEETETSIKMRLLNETSWRKRASLAALLISKSIEY
jgi:hypothetical protein